MLAAGERLELTRTFSDIWERLDNLLFWGYQGKKQKRDKNRWRQVRAQCYLLPVFTHPNTSSLWQPSLGDGAGWHWPQEHQVDPTLEEWASKFVLAWLLLPHQLMHSQAFCYPQWLLHVQTRTGVAHLTSALACLWDRNMRKLSFSGLSSFGGEQSPFLSRNPSLVL